MFFFFIYFNFIFFLATKSTFKFAHFDFCLFSKLFLRLGWLGAQGNILCNPLGSVANRQSGEPLIWIITSFSSCLVHFGNILVFLTRFSASKWLVIGVVFFYSFTSYGEWEFCCCLCGDETSWEAVTANWRSFLLLSLGKLRKFFGTSFFHAHYVNHLKMATLSATLSFHSVIAGLLQRLFSCRNILSCGCFLSYK